MKKRSKLNLSPETKQRKAQAGGFASKTASNPEAKSESKSSHEDNHDAKQNPRPKLQRSRQHTRVNQQPSGPAATITGFKPSRKLMMTTAVVVAVAVLAFYGLRRR